MHSGHSAIAASAAQISKDSQAALQSLYKKEPKAKQVGGKSVSGFGFPEYPIYENLDQLRARLVQIRDNFICSVSAYIFITMTTLLTGAQVAAAKMDTPSNTSLESEASRTGPPTTDTKQRRSPFAAGRWLLSGYGSAAVGTGDRVFAGHVGLSYYFFDNISLTLESVGYFVDHANTTGGGGLDLLPRWHFLQAGPLVAVP